MACARGHIEHMYEEPRDLVLDALNPPEWEPAHKRGKATERAYPPELMAHVARCKPLPSAHCFSA